MEAGSALYPGESSTISGGGLVILDGSSITGAGKSKINRAYFTNGDDTIAGSGSIETNLVFVNDALGVVDADVKGSLTLDVGKLTVSNAGLIEATNGGDCVIRSPVANTGTLLADGGTLTLDAAVTGSGAVDLTAGKVVIENAGAAEAVAFTGKKGVLQLNRSQTYAGAVSGFSKTGATTLDLRDIGFVSPTEATYSGTARGGVLTVTDGAHTARIDLVGNYTASTFVASSDGAGGVDIVDPTAPAPSVQRFAAAMATLGGHGEGSPAANPAGPAWGVHTPVLLAPRAAIA